MLAVIDEGLAEHEADVAGLGARHAAGPAGDESVCH